MKNILILLAITSTMLFCSCEKKTEVNLSIFGKYTEEVDLFIVSNSGDTALANYTQLANFEFVKKYPNQSEIAMMNYIRDSSVISIWDSASYELREDEYSIIIREGKTEESTIFFKENNIEIKLNMNATIFFGNDFYKNKNLRIKILPKETNIQFSPEGTYTYSYSFWGLDYGTNTRFSGTVSAKGKKLV